MWNIVQPTQGGNESSSADHRRGKVECPCILYYQWTNVVWLDLESGIYVFVKPQGKEEVSKFLLKVYIKANAFRGYSWNASKMKQIYIFLFFFVGSTVPASKYYDGPIRPYQFGYSIDKNQHRFEKKGKRTDTYLWKKMNFLTLFLIFKNIIKIIKK